jgi:hypothetical protein
MSNSISSSVHATPPETRTAAATAPPSATTGGTVPKDTVQISDAAKNAQLASESVPQLQKDARNGNVQAKHMLAKIAAAAAERHREAVAATEPAKAGKTK